MGGSNETPQLSSLLLCFALKNTAGGCSGSTGICWVPEWSQCQVTTCFSYHTEHKPQWRYLGIIFLTFHFSLAFGIWVQVSGTYTWEQSSSWPEPGATFRLDYEMCHNLCQLSHHPCVFFIRQIKNPNKNQQYYTNFPAKEMIFFYLHKATFSKELNIQIFGKTLVKASLCREKEDRGSFPLNCYSIILFCSSANCPFFC